MRLELPARGLKKKLGTAGRPLADWLLAGLTKLTRQALPRLLSPSSRPLGPASALRHRTRRDAVLLCL